MNFYFEHIIIKRTKKKRGSIPCGLNITRKDYTLVIVVIDVQECTQTFINQIFDQKNKSNIIKFI